MSSRGRGSRGYGGSRGSYRGGVGGSGGYRGRGGRGGFSSGGAADRYVTSDRYSRSERPDDMSYKRSYRSEVPSYSSRDHGGRGGSPDRKRMRLEGPGRRSHEGGAHYASEYGSRHDTSYERRTYIDSRRSPAREYAGSCKKELALPTTRPRSPRRSYRARAPRSSYRGSTRGTRRILSRPSDYIRRIKQVKMRSVLAANQASSSSEAEENWDKEEKKPKEEGTESPAKIKPKKEKVEGEAEGEAGDATDKEGRAGSGDDADVGEKEEKDQSLRQRQYIKLTCPHCREKALTFKTYTRHLQSRKHQYTMDEVATKLKTMLQRMRTAQRTNQRALDNEPGTSHGEQLFCPLCKLIYRSSKMEHYRSNEHKNMKKFLLPECRVCDATFKAPMMFEHHICSLEHIKKKALIEKKPKAEGAGSGEEGMDVDLENFMTLDSVGDVDEVDDEDSGDADKKEGEAEPKPKPSVNIGSEHVKKVEVYYCELCKVYLPRSGGELALRRHCKVRTHLARYVRFRDNRTLRKQAERIHRIHQQQAKEGKKENAAEGSGEATIKTEPAPADAEANGEAVAAAGESARNGEGDALWSEDVDKELGELLRDVDQPHKSSDDEDDSNTGRYDRFRKSDKKADGNAAAIEDASAKKETVATNGTSDSLKPSI